MAARLLRTLTLSRPSPAASTTTTTTTTTSFAQTPLRRRPNPTPLPRTFQTTSTMKADSLAPPKKPIGAFRGSLFGFLLGTVLAGGGLYFSVVEQYKVSNELLVEDVYALQSAVQRLEGYVKALETEVKTGKK